MNRTKVLLIKLTKSLLKTIHKPTLRSQAHWLVAQPKPSKELAYPNAQQTETVQQIDRGIFEDKEHQALTSAACQVRQQWFSVGIFRHKLLFGLTGIENRRKPNRPQLSTF